jgi:hypothetical protein
LRESEDALPTEVLRTKRLEFVDDKGEVRAVLGTREEGVGGLSVYDASGRVRVRLEAGEFPDQGSGLSVLDTDGNPRVVVNMNNDPDKDSALILLDTDGKQRAVVNQHASGQAGLSPTSSWLRWTIPAFTSCSPGRELRRQFLPH